MHFWQRILSFRRAHILPKIEFEQYLKDMLRQQEKRSRWMNVACIDLILPEGTTAEGYNVEKILRDYARTVISQLEPKRYALMCAMLPEDAERHLDRIQRELRNAALVYPQPAAFNVSLLTFNCFIPVAEFDHKMDHLLGELPGMGQNILFHEIVQV